MCRKRPAECLPDLPALSLLYVVIQMRGNKLEDDPRKKLTHITPPSLSLRPAYQPHQRKSQLATTLPAEAHLSDWGRSLRKADAGSSSTPSIQTEREPGQAVRPRAISTRPRLLVA
nr:MAG TPA: hypothetical protein [Caudoviricetes sp.]